MVQALFPPSEGYGISAEQAAMRLPARRRQFMQVYAQDIGRQTMEGVFVDGFPFDTLDSFYDLRADIDSEEALDDSQSPDGGVGKENIAVHQSSANQERIVVPEWDSRKLVMGSVHGPKASKAKK